VSALLAWLHGGGHLVLGVEQPTDVTSLPWLASLLPCEITGLTTLEQHDALQSWLNADSRPVRGARFSQGQPRPSAPGARHLLETPAALPVAEAGESLNPFPRLPADPAFEGAPLPVARASRRDGTVLLGTEQAPLAIQAARGRGTLTVLLFSPELEPFRSWQNRSWFWARLMEVPVVWLAGANWSRSSGYHIDGLFGAMTDTQQIRKLPVAWLFLLLVAYLAVIGPVDRYVLKRLNKQMLTWLTFPAYVALFSLLIYYIGYRLRAGEAEWNEFHVVDVIPHGERADLRGRAYGSIYSPVNAQYPVSSEAPSAALRGEVGYFGGQEVSKADITVQANSFKARLDAPIWTSQLFVNDWWCQGPVPIHLTVHTLDGGGWQVSVENLTGRTLTNAFLVVGGNIHKLPPLARTSTFQIERAGGERVATISRNHSGGFAQAVSARRSQLGRLHALSALDPFFSAVAASFLPEERASEDGPRRWQSFFSTLRGLDLTPNAERGDAILLAWMPGDLLIAPMNQFNPKRSHKQTLLRVVASPR
jgi:hypothetical protein